MTTNLSPEAAVLYLRHFDGTKRVRPRFMKMKRDWFIITLPTFLAALVITAAVPVRDAISQELDRRPCVNPGSPAGCVPLTRAPQAGPATTINPDAPGIVPVTDWPATKPNAMPPDWKVAPDYLPKDGTVTVEPVTEAAPPQEQAPP